MTHVIQNKFRQWMEKVTLRFLLGSFTEFLNERALCLNKDQPIKVMKERLRLRQSPESLLCPSLGPHRRTPTGAKTLTLRMQ